MQTNTSTGQIPLNFSSLSDTSSSLLTQKPDTEQAITEFKTPQPRIPPLKFKLSHPLNVSSELLVLSPTKSKKRKRKNDEDTPEELTSSPSSSSSLSYVGSPETPTTPCKYSPLCLLCALSKKTIFALTWKDILILCFRSIQRHNPKKGEWLHVPSDIFVFIEEHIPILWNTGRKTVENWKKRIHDTLCHNKDFFESGKDNMDRKGFWALSPLALSVQIEDNEQRQTRKHRTKKNKKRKLEEQIETSTNSTNLSNSISNTSNCTEPNEFFSLDLSPSKNKKKSKTPNTKQIKLPKKGKKEKIYGEICELISDLSEEDLKEDEGVNEEEEIIHCFSPPSVPTPSSILTPSWRLVEDYEESVASQSFFKRPKEYIHATQDATFIYKELHERLSPKRAFWMKLHDFLHQQKNPIATYPYIAFYPLDLYALYLQVLFHGGYKSISTANDQKLQWSPQWETIFCKLIKHKGPDFNPTEFNEELLIGDPRIRRSRLKYFYERYLLSFEEAHQGASPETFLSFIGEGKSNYIRCICGHTHYGASADIDCVSCKIEIEKINCGVDHIQCEACGCWQHFQCVLDENLLEPSELLLLQDPDFHFYCEMCSEKDYEVTFSKKMLPIELPLDWTCERKLKGRVQKYFDFYFFAPGNQYFGQKSKDAIKSFTELKNCIKTLNETNQ